jgi:hypothetical protein
LDHFYADTSLGAPALQDFTGRRSRVGSLRFRFDCGCLGSFGGVVLDRHGLACRCGLLPAVSEGLEVGSIGSCCLREMRDDWVDAHECDTMISNSIFTTFTCITTCSAIGVAHERTAFWNLMVPRRLVPTTHRSHNRPPPFGDTEMWSYSWVGNMYVRGT